jgi:hypothetical protein
VFVEPGAVDFSTSKGHLHSAQTKKVDINSVGKVRRDIAQGTKVGSWNLQRGNYRSWIYVV